MVGGAAFGAVRRMCPGFVGLALALAVLRIGLYGLQLTRLARRSGPLGSAAASGLWSCSQPPWATARPRPLVPGLIGRAATVALRSRLPADPSTASATPATR